MRVFFWITKELNGFVSECFPICFDESKDAAQRIRTDVFIVIFSCYLNILLKRLFVVQ